ncbi:peptide chain release factor N(5)-glutamine methyltransferase [Rickettsiaceae bacterium]|nr:peptide chain release factor N(5)-glutamine methyltransferase [Rickettsiaceae bacterium]
MRKLYINPMQIREALQKSKSSLTESSTPELDARLLLSKILSLTHEELLLSYQEELPDCYRESFFEYIKRRKSGEPVAYIIGKQEFYGLDFIVDKNVLIPRPETELLVDHVISDHNKNDKSKPIKILELGTGSGAISIALAKNISASKITALDISNKALCIAKKNAKLHQLERQIDFITSNWYRKLESREDSFNKYDYIVSNPPYISKQDIDQMSVEAKKFEPEIALYASENGLVSYKAIISGAYRYLKQEGKLILEIGYNQKDAVVALCKKYNFQEIITKKDVAGLDRVVIVQSARI